MKRVIAILLLCISTLSCTNQTADMSTSAPDNPQSQVLHDQINWNNFETHAQGEIIYVPIYSSIYHQSGQTFDLTATLSVHNVDMNHNIQLVRVNYYNTAGQLIRKYIQEPISLSPFQTKQFVIPSVDKTGGTGANFVVQWASQTQVNAPMTEAIMIATAQGQGLSFATHGKVIGTLTP